MKTITFFSVFESYFLFVHSQILPDNSTVDLSAAECTVDVSKSLSATPPLFINPGTTEFRRASNTKGIVRFKGGESLLLACPGRENWITVQGNKKAEGVAKCVKGTNFNVFGKTLDISKISCNAWPEALEKATNNRCIDNGEILEIGFEISTGFSKLIEICYDKKLDRTIYTKFTLRPDAASSQYGVTRPDWLTGTLFRNMDVNYLYRRVAQQKLLNRLLGNGSGAKYVQLTGDFFLAKGHLTAKSDFLYGTQQMATFFYSNAAPQWQTFNGKNWNNIEGDVRTYASRVNEDLEVFTGTAGECTLPSTNGGKPIHLSLNGNGRIPVPGMFWKVVYSAKRKVATVFIGLNNPYEKNVQKDILCKDICNQINWLTWDQKNIVKGYSYCCSYKEFVEKFKIDFKLHVQGNLK